jgi:UDP-glucose 4-epimerase
MRVLVTGGTGYIGSTAVEILLQQGFEISILDDCSTGHADTAPAGVRFIQGSLLNPSEVADALTGCDAVMHFAGKSLVGESVEKPDLYHSVNVGAAFCSTRCANNPLQRLFFHHLLQPMENQRLFPSLKAQKPTQQTHMVQLSWRLIT